MINYSTAALKHANDGGLSITWLSPEKVHLHDNYLKNWLFDTSSLTERLQSMCRQFEVVVINHAMQTPDAEECSLLECDPTATYIREVLLLGDQVPWVYARSVIPKAINDAELGGLGNQPLGKRIFNDARFSRGEFQLCALSWSQVCQALNNKSGMVVPLEKKTKRESLYGRRSCFEFLGSRMSVAEIFLPEAPAYAD